MKIVVDLCESNARCVQACPEVFSVNEEDRPVIVVERPEEILRAKVQPWFVVRGVRHSLTSDPEDTCDDNVP